MSIVLVCSVFVTKLISEYEMKTLPELPDLPNEDDSLVPSKYEISQRKE